MGLRKIVVMELGFLNLTVLVTWPVVYNLNVPLLHWHLLGVWQKPAPGIPILFGISGLNGTPVGGTFATDNVFRGALRHVIE